MSATSSKRVLINKDFVAEDGNVGGVPMTSEEKPREEMLHTSQDIAYNSITQVPSPRRAVHVRSPLKYKDGQLQPPSALGTQVVPHTASKAISSYDVIEGSPDRKTVTQNQFKGKSDRNLITESNFFDAKIEGGVATKKTNKEKTSNRSNFPQIMHKLMEQTQGSFQKDGPERYINDFFTADIISSPRYRQDETTAAKLMQMRLDSRGSPLRRTFLGNVDHYIQGRNIQEQKAKSRMGSQKLSTGGQNIIQSQGLPQIGVSPRLTISKPKDSTILPENSRNQQFGGDRSTIMAQSIRVDSSMKREPLTHKRNLTVGFNSNQLQSHAYATISGEQEPSQLLEAGESGKVRQPLKLTDLMSSQMLNTMQPGSIDNSIISNPSLLDGGQSFTSNLTKRIANAMLKHDSAQYKWLKQIQAIRKHREQDDMNTTHAKKKLQRSLRNTSLGSLLERQSTFAYDDLGTKRPSIFWQHKSPKRDEENPADLQLRVNDFYQNVRGSDVAYVTTDSKNPNVMLWSTSPTNRAKRGEAAKKDIAKMPSVRRKSKIFRAYNKTIEPSDKIYQSKVFTEAKKGRYIADLAQKRDKSLIMNSLMQSSVDMQSD